MSVRLVVLGSGTSHGVPMIGCDCAVCTSDDPRDKRTRTSVVFSYGSHTILVDTAPELRLQCVACDVRRVDAILFTHYHADHITGLDDVRRFNWIQDTPITVYGDRETLDRLWQMFPYAFEDDPEYPSAKPELNTALLDGPFDLFGERVIPVPLMHGSLPVYGFRVGGIAYCTDCNGIPASSYELLRDLDVLLLDAVRHQPHATHFTVEQAVAEAQRIGAKRTYFTHIAHALGHAETNAQLPAGMELAYDGLVCESP
jgi:phosphoribosyl 1,2-cyclic phosphate phosphodiesterase